MEKEAVERREAEEKADAMKALEHRTIDSKLEMDIMDALEETKVGKTHTRRHTHTHTRTLTHPEVWVFNCACRSCIDWRDGFSLAPTTCHIRPPTSTPA